ncbi:MAG: hypothetical protein ACOC6H_01010 [Thermoproteota archaeon]
MESKIEETERVLAKKFGGYKVLLKVFLSNTQHSVVPWQEFEHLLPQCQGMIRNRKEVPVLACILACTPHFVVTGDKTLREDLSECQETSETKTGSSVQFLRWFKKLNDSQVGENPS